MERIMLAPGVYLNTIEAQKFNRCRISLHFRFPASGPVPRPMPCCRLCWTGAMPIARI